MASSISGLERLLRRVCALYPRDFRRLLAADMAALYVREYRRIEARRGRAAAVRFAAGTLAGAIGGAITIRLRGVAPPRLQMDVLLQDLRYALRNLTRGRAVTAVAVLSLALGIGANTAIFSVVNAVLLRGLPYPDADRLVVLYESNAEIGVDRAGPSGATFLDWRERAESFDAMALFQPGSATITDLSEPEQVPAMRVTVGFLPLLGYEPALGRGFMPEEGHGGRQNVAIATRGFWRRAWGGDPARLGEQFMGDHTPYTLVGVLPEEFWFPLSSDLFVPWDEAELRADSRWDRENGALARLAPGVTLEQANAELTAIAGQLAVEHPEVRGWTTRAEPVHEEITGALRPALWVALGAVTFVLLIACANVANLLLARGAGRERELAVRAATGASRGRLMRQLLTESLLLAAAGGALGLGAGWLGLRGLNTILPPELPLPDGNVSVLLPVVTMDATVLAFTAGAALLTGLVFGLIPAWQLSLIDLNGSLKGAGRSASAARGSIRARGALVVGEIALAVVLLVGAALMLQTFWNLGAVDPGFDPAGVLTLQMELPTDTRYATDDEQAPFYRQVLANMELIPGVEAAGISEILPLDAASRRLDVRLEAADLPADGSGLGVDYNIAGAGFFEALRIPLLRGRTFEDRDDRDHPNVAIVDEAFVAAHLEGREPIGARFEAWRDTFEIVGVVGSVRSAGLDRRPRPTVWFHYLQVPDNMMSFVLRAAGDPAQLTAAAKEAVWAVDPEQPLFNVRPMEGVVAQGGSARRLTLLLLGLFGAVAVGMASLGVYGVLSYAVGQRTRELGLRQALGADAGRVLALVFREGAVLAGTGVLIGVGAALLLSRSLASMLYGVAPSHPATLSAVAALLLTVAALATWLPARRAASVDPVIALRGE